MSKTKFSPVSIVKTTEMKYSQIISLLQRTTSKKHDLTQMLFTNLAIIYSFFRDFDCSFDLGSNTEILKETLKKRKNKLAPNITLNQKEHIFRYIPSAF